MIVDSSAILAILFAEPDAAVCAAAMSAADSWKVSAATFVEVAVVVETQTNGRGNLQFDTFSRRVRFSIEPVTEEQARIARQAFSSFGRGRHPAGLNFGDCFSYALAKVKGETPLFKGGDFSGTDIASALGWHALSAACAAGDCNTAVIIDRSCAVEASHGPGARGVQFGCTAPARPRW